VSTARVVAVLGERQGTGVLLAPRLVLTCSHVVGNDKRPEIAHPSRTARTISEVQWRDDTLDAALLVSDHDIVDTGPAGPLGRLRIGELATESPLPHCEIVGFPDIQRYGADGALELDQYRAAVLPAAGALRSALVCELDRAPAEERHDGTSPLQGLSGSPVFAGPVLLGIVTEVPRGRGQLRVEGVPMARILAATGPSGATSLLDSFLATPVTDFHPQDQRFEESYARALKAHHRKTKIVGIDELDTSEATWDLDTAYLSLETGHRDGSDQPFPPDQHAPHPTSSVGGPGRVDDLLESRPRTLLRGEAGAGKTTLVSWLAAHAACGTLGRQLADLNGLVPFVVPLRTVHRRGLPSPDQLPAVAGTLAGEPPPGWARRVLESGRCLLLVDGVDEVPSAARENVKVWLDELLDLYPATRCVVTVRPLAVEEDWLRVQRFEELLLLPMRDEDIGAFVTAWHTAARLESDTYGDLGRAVAETAKLSRLEAELHEQFRRNSALRTLAQTPLLCAVICALHRRRGGLLPETRWDLYRATLATLLDSRDTQREVKSPEGIRMSLDAHRELLQSIALWLLRGNQTELSRQDAEQQIEVAMRRLPKVRSQATPRAVLTHLLNRSGLLQERADDEIQFIHHTFQDYLAARAVIEGGALKELIQNAHDEQWRDTVLLAVGHCRPEEARRLIKGLLTNGENTADRARRETLYVLAAHCFLDAVVVDEEVGELVASRIRTMLPPRGMADVYAMASLGDDLLPHLPDPSTLTPTEALYVTDLICEIGGGDAVPYAKRYARYDSQDIRSRLTESWGMFPAEKFAREVLATMPLAGVGVDHLDQLRLLRELLPFYRLTLRGDFSGDQLKRHLTGVAISRLSLVRNKVLDDLTFVRRLPRLRELTIIECPGVTQLAPLQETRVVQLAISLRGNAQAQLAQIKHIPKLTRLSLTYENTTTAQELPDAHPGVRFLYVDCRKQIDLSTLRPWGSLVDLTLRLDSCTWLTGGRHTFVLAPQVKSLTLRIRSDYAGLKHVATAFPSLVKLDLAMEVLEGGVLDLTYLYSLADLQITVSGYHVRARLVGAKHFGSRLTVKGLSPA
jgi:hypothetical protein